MAQIAAEALGVPYDQIVIDTADTDTGPHCMGTFASRGTHRVGNAVKMAALEARDAVLQLASEELEVAVEDLVLDGRATSRWRARRRSRCRSPTSRRGPSSSTGGRSRAAACS